jgi:hypothetical protein
MRLLFWPQQVVYMRCDKLPPSATIISEEASSNAATHPRFDTPCIAVVCKFRVGVSRYLGIISGSELGWAGCWLDMVDCWPGNRLIGQHSGRNSASSETWHLDVQLGKSPTADPLFRYIGPPTWCSQSNIPRTARLAIYKASHVIHKTRIHWKCMKTRY